MAQPGKFESVRDTLPLFVHTARQRGVKRAVFKMMDHPGKPIEVFATDEHFIGLKPVTRRTR